MRASLESAARGYSIYKARRAEFETNQKIPFRVSPKPFRLTSEQKREIQIIGHDIVDYFQTVNELYQSDVGGVRKILDTGKPQIFLSDKPAQYLFVRPDLIITPQGFSICEIETSPFGLALAEILNKAYQDEGFETVVANGSLPEEVRRNTPIEGTILLSDKNQSYAGQLTFLADQVFSGNGRNWQALPVNQYNPNGNAPQVYRGFYLREYLTDPAVRLLLDTNLANGNSNGIFPSATPHLEEKAILALIYDIRFEQYLRTQLGDAAFNHLKEIIPPTWIVGQEKFFSPGMPNNISTSVELAGLSKSKRTFVLKSSGFSENSSWKEGVYFLHKDSKENAEKLLQQAQTDITHLHVVQEFKKGINIPMKYEDLGNEDVHLPMTARIRLTPYFALSENGKSDKLIAMKATGCENTDFIHASSTSINTAVS